jgi:dTDP-4-amino-4,6-dideoxygalactose transaminase
VTDLDYPAGGTIEMASDDGGVVVPLVTPARPADASEAVLADMAEILAAGRYRVGDGHAATVASLLADQYDLPVGWNVLTFRSGTDALARALAGLGVGAGARVGLPDLAYHAVAGVVLMAGGTPVPLDVDAHDWNLSVDALAAALDDDGLDAVIAVDNYGTPCDRAALGDLCRRWEIPLVLDACESLGADDPSGRPVSDHVDAVAVSFSFTKPVHAAGAGGALATKEKVATRVLEHEHLLSRQVQLPELNAAFLARTWAQLDANVDRLRGQYDRYRAVLEPLGFVAQPERGRGTRLHAPFLLPEGSTTSDRERLVGRLGDAGIEARPMFPSQSRLLGLGAPPPVSAEVDRRVLCFPTGSGLEVPDVADRVAAVVTGWLAA